MNRSAISPYTYNLQHIKIQISYISEKSDAIFDSNNVK